MRFFGQAIDGDIDLGEDGLPDIVVGSQGMAVVLRYGHRVHQVCTIVNPKPLKATLHLNAQFLQKKSGTHCVRIYHLLLTVQV